MNHAHHLNCKDILANMNDYIDGELEQSVCEEIEAHVKDCPNCTIVLSTLKKTIHIYQVDGQETQVPDDVRQRLFKNLDLDQTGK